MKNRRPVWPSLQGQEKNALRKACMDWTRRQFKHNFAFLKAKVILFCYADLFLEFDLLEFE